MGWVNYPHEHQTYLDACFEASLRRGLPGAIIFSDSVINHRHYFNLQCTYYSCHCVIAMAIKLWANLKPEEETIISFFVNEKKFALIEEQLWINNIFSKIFDWIVWHLLWAATKANKLLPSSKEWWLSMSQSQSVRLFIIPAQPLGSIIFRWFSDRK